MLSAEEQSQLDHTPLDFGKYKGRTPNDISETDCAYLIWAYENVLNRPVFMSEVLYKECLKTPNVRPPKSATIGTSFGGVSTRTVKPPAGSLAESRSHFDDPDDTPF